MSKKDELSKDDLPNEYDFEENIDDFIDDLDDFADDIDDVADDIDDVIDDTINDDPYNYIEDEFGGESGGGTKPKDDYWKKVSDKYGKKVAERLEPFGEDGKTLIDIYEEAGKADDVVRAIKNLSDDEAREGVQLITEYLDDATRLLGCKNSVKTTKTVCEVLKEEKISITELERMKLKLQGTLDDWEVDVLKKMRERFLKPTSDTWMKKIMTEGSTRNYLNGKYGDKVRGYMAEAEYSEGMTEYKEVIESFRLDYEVNGMRPYPDDGDGYSYVLFKTKMTDEFEVPYGSQFGGNTTDGPPCTQNGFLGSENGRIN